ncbi:MAG: autotransporter-associated beta strand repeat-containing protein [Bacteroidaceae bacterium]|nr:autotransporter-associated beta strand repeat-containing protein [Bacteroidaceae bacterium]
MRKILLLISMLAASASGFAQRSMDAVDRGLVAMPTSSGNFVSWRIFGEEYYDVEYNLYRDGTLLNSKPLKVSNYTDRGGNVNSKYTVAPVVRGKEQAQSEAVTPWRKQDASGNYYWEIPVQPAYDRNGADASSDYVLNDVSLADLDGDGISEFIVKRKCGSVADVSQKIRFHQLDCYDYKGNRLWWIDLGPNMLAGADEQWDAVAYDWDGDGKAEVLMRGQDNMIIHHADGTTTTIGSTTVDTRWNGIEYTSSGNEYLLYLEGATAKPYQIGPSSHPNYMNYPLTRGTDADWGAGIVGHRSTKHFFGAPFLDGRHASIFLGRGIYTKHKMAAFDVDPVTHALTQIWSWECSASGPWFGQGYHNYAIADVDWDGRDEIVYGSMVIDDNGKGLSTTGLGHGDAQHCSDLDPYRHGQEQFACNETSPAMNYRNATTSEIYYRAVAGGDDGRALCANFTNQYPGSVGRSVTTGWVSSVADKIISELNGDAFIGWGDLNWRIYWDGDLCDEYLESPGTEGYAVVYKPGTGARLLSAGGTKLNNWSKNNPGAVGDLFGDWREEIVLRDDANKALRIYTTNIPTTYRNYTLWHDHQYRNAMVWQSLGYNQPPHKSYFLGELEGITMAPPPLTMTGRTEIANGGTITNEDKHFIVCETADTKISIADGASPYIVTFNVPTWVQGSASSNSTSANTPITTTVYTCDVTGGALTGDTKLVKQGDGVLNLPNVKMTYTGETNIWAGVVNFDGTMENSPVWLNRFAELNSNGGVFNKGIRMDYGSKVRPGGADNKGTLTTDSLIMNFGSRLIIDVYGKDLTADVIKAKCLKTEKKNWKYGPAYLVPVMEFVYHGEGENAEVVKGKYLIGEIGEIVGDLGDIKVSCVAGLKCNLSYEDGKLYLNIADMRDASSVVWTGALSNIWNFAETENFADAADMEAKEIFVLNDKAIFNDAATVFNVQLSDELPADTVFVDNTQAYTFGGDGKLTGDATLVKTGTGMLTISNDNTYTGGNRISGGTVRVSSLSNEYQAHGNLGAVTSSPEKFIIENGATLQTTATVQMGSPIRLDGEEGGVINNSADFTMNKAFSGTVLTKKGTGWLKLSNNNASLGKLVVTAGTVEANCATPAKSIEVSGGTINLNQGSSSAINVPAGKNATVNYYSDRATYSNKLTGAGTVTVYYPLVAGSGWYATRASLTGNWSEFEGTVKPTGVSGDGRFCLNNSFGIPKGKMDIASGIEVQNTAKTYKIGEVTGKGSLGGVCVFSSSAPSGANTWQVGDEGNFKFEGKVTSNSNFVKAGTGKMTVAGVWDNTGTVKINEGELHFNSGSSLGTGVLTVAEGAVLSGATSTTVTLKNSMYTINGTVQVGATATAVIGVLDFGSKNVTFNSGSVYRVGVRRCATATNSGGTSIQGIKKLTMNGTISVFMNDSYEPVDGDSVRLWVSDTFAGTPEFDLPALGNSLVWDTSRIAEGLLFIKYDPTGIDAIAADEEVNVAVISTNGTVIGNFTSACGDVDEVFKNMDIPSGVYLLNVRGKSASGVKKMVK